MKRKLSAFFAVFLTCSLVFSQEDPQITEIRNRFQKWQPKIGQKLNNCKKFWNYVWGETYENSKWLDKQIDDDSFVLSEKVSFIEDNELGYYVYIEYFTVSGDWSIVSDYYYTKDGKLYFVFWRMNTSNAEIPVTVEKRLYFNVRGEKIRDLKSVFKLNTKEKTEVNFMDKEVEYKLNLKDMDFYKYWKK